MKPAEIECGVYLGHNGIARKILFIRGRELGRRVLWQPLALEKGRKGGWCSVQLFARWAVRRADEMPVERQPAPQLGQPLARELRPYRPAGLPHGRP